MPHYDYHCSQCGHQLQNVFQKMTDGPLTDCPQCHQSSLKRGPGGGSGLIFKGSGFYITDYDPQRQVGSDSSKDSNTSCCPCGKNECS